MKKIIILGMILILCCTGCRPSQNQPVDISSEAKQLFEHKNQYIGDASANGQLLRLLKVSEELGKYTMELKTDQPPYWIQLNFEEVPADRDKFEQLMQEKAYYILALVENADEVRYCYPYVEEGKEKIVTGSITKEKASEDLGEDVKTYGNSEEGIQKMIDRFDTIK